MGTNRSDFSQLTKDLLCIYAGGHCSICGTLTTWKDQHTGKKVSIGEAAHIEAAAEGGPRFNPNQTDEQRASIDNGIWLCSNCHTKIDSNADYYTVTLLHCYKNNAMEKEEKNERISLQGNGGVSTQDFTRSMLSFFSKIYGYRESLHNTIRAVKKYTDGFFQEFESEDWFYTHYAFGDCDLFKNLNLIKNNIWVDKLPPLIKGIKEGRLFISDCYELEKDYIEIISICPIIDEEWWKFFSRIKTNYDKLDEINTRLLTEYKKKYDSFLKDL